MTNREVRVAMMGELWDGFYMGPTTPQNKGETFGEWVAVVADAVSHPLKELACEYRLLKQLPPDEEYTSEEAITALFGQDSLPSLTGAGQ